VIPVHHIDQLHAYILRVLLVGLTIRIIYVGFISFLFTGFALSSQNYTWYILYVSMGFEAWTNVYAGIHSSLESEIVQSILMRAVHEISSIEEFNTVTHASCTALAPTPLPI
jgi:hypothetical protein